jgi:hypothetical protein
MTNIYISWKECGIAKFLPILKPNTPLFNIKFEHGSQHLVQISATRKTHTYRFSSQTK